MRASTGLYLPDTVMVTARMEVEAMTFPIHGVETAPESSKPLLRGLKENLGMVPNLAAAMAESPQLLGGFLAVRDIYSGGTFTPGEIQVLSLTAAYESPRSFPTRT